MEDINLFDFKQLEFVWYSSIRQLNRQNWDLLGHELPTPFLDWEWLRLLEDSGSASPATGWQPQHLTVWNQGRLVGAAPLFIKMHSQGEFVFDQIWAQLAAKMNRDYYPKLVGMSPFTPIGAYRFLQKDPENQFLTRLMQEEIDSFCQKNVLSGCHFHFLDPSWRHRLQELSFLSWVHPGFIWENEDYRSFDDYLARFRANRRKNIKKERQSLAAQNIRIVALTGEDIQEKHLFWMYRYYIFTNQRYFPWSCKYLTQDFFLGLAQDLKKYLLLLLAFIPDQEQPVGMSMLVFKGDKLFGRYWGGQEGIPFLHFNLCYYEPIRWAIENRIQWFDPGMGGEHKLYRGFKLVPNYSLHKVYAPGLQQVMGMYLQEINALEKQRMQELNKELPFK